MTPAPLMGAVIGGVTIIVPDYDAGIAFYCGVLGFDLIENLDQGHKRWVTVAPPAGVGSAQGRATRVILARAETAEQRAAIGQHGGGRVWLFLHSPDFARDHAAMLAAGVDFEEEPRPEAYGTVAVWRDPFGNRWDLIGLA